MQSTAASLIAERFLPSRYHYWYARSKLSTDPLYAVVRDIVATTQAPLLDVGCGIGLLLHDLRAHGISLEYYGVDIDDEKIGIARRAAEFGRIGNARFEVVDLVKGFPAHSGSVVLLDVLQYLEAGAGDLVLDRASQCVSRGAKLVIRAGIDDGSWRARFTRFMDRAGHAVRWMKTPPRSQPTRRGLQELLERHGFASEFLPAWGRTPFNNWVVIASR